MKLRAALPLLLLLALTPGCRPAAPATAYQLPFGPPGQRHRLVTLRPGDLHAAGIDRRVGFESMVERLARARVVLVGEVHDRPEPHLAQARILEALARRAPGQVALGLEMLDPSADAALAAYVAGRIDERELVRSVRWYETWGFPYRLYRPVLQAARAHRVSIHGLNLQLGLVRQVGRGGLEALPPAARASLPPVERNVPRHRTVFAALLGLGPGPRRGGSPGPHGGVHGVRLDWLHQAQSLRDEVMAWNVRRILERPGGPRQVVVLAGNGHVVYGEGVNGRLRRRAPGLAQATVVCLGVPPEGERVARGLGDYLWAFDATAPADPPGLGLRIEAAVPGPGVRVAGMAPGSAAGAAGVRAGDVILTVDGVPVTGPFELRWHLEAVAPGAPLALRLRRGGEELGITVRLPAPTRRPR